MNRERVAKPGRPMRRACAGTCTSTLVCVLWVNVLTELKGHERPDPGKGYRVQYDDGDAEDGVDFPDDSVRLLPPVE